MPRRRGALGHTVAGPPGLPKWTAGPRFPCRSEQVPPARFSVSGCCSRPPAPGASPGPGARHTPARSAQTPIPGEPGQQQHHGAGPQEHAAPAGPRTAKDSSSGASRRRRLAGWRCTTRGSVPSRPLADRRMNGLSQSSTLKAKWNSSPLSTPLVAKITPAMLTERLKTSEPRSAGAGLSAVSCRPPPPTLGFSQF